MTKNAVCLCADKNMMVPALFVADAAKRRSPASADGYDVILFAPPEDLTDAHRQWLRDRDIGVCDDLDISRLEGIAKPDPRLTVVTLAKLLIPGRLAGRYDKVLYLDADLTLEQDIAPLFRVDTGEFALAAVPAGRVWAGRDLRDRERTHAHFRALGMTEPFKYFNTGVLLIDVAKWRRDDLAARALAFIQQNPELCPLPDEDALNAVLDGRLAELSPLWNMRAFLWAHREIRDIASVAIVHYAGLDKPWKRFGFGRRRRQYLAAYEAYEQFVRGTPWQGWLDDQWTGRNLRDGLVHEMRFVLRRLRWRPRRARERADRAEAFRRYCLEERFADVEQEIVTQDADGLRLQSRERPRVPAMAG